MPWIDQAFFKQPYLVSISALCIALDTRAIFNKVIGFYIVTIMAPTRTHILCFSLQKDPPLR